MKKTTDQEEQVLDQEFKAFTEEELGKALPENDKEFWLPKLHAIADEMSNVAQTTKAGEWLRKSYDLSPEELRDASMASLMVLIAYQLSKSEFGKHVGKNALEKVMVYLLKDELKRMLLKQMPVPKGMVH